MSPQPPGGKAHDPGLGRTVIDDLKKARWQRLGEEFRELYFFYLDEDARNRLAGMGRVRRAILLLGWLLKSLLMKLSPARRIMLLIALVFTVMGKTGLGFSFGGWSLVHDLRPWGFLLLLIVLMLELKDKLLAKDEIQIAREVQVALLPDEDAEIPGWAVWSCSRPANDVGGDLVDYIELDGFRHGVVLGDVAGKGLGAALLSAKLQATLRALVPEATSLDDLASRVNTIFFRDGLENRYATLFYAELEYDSGQLRYLNAGHNPAFLIQAAGTDKLGASALPLGMLPASNYKECTLDLRPGDVLLAYSDGLTEAENAAGEEFGMQRLEALLPELAKLEPQACGRRLLKEVDRFVGDVRPYDDLSLVIIRRK